MYFLGGIWTSELYIAAVIVQKMSDFKIQDFPAAVYNLNINYTLAIAAQTKYIYFCFLLFCIYKLAVGEL